VLRELIEQERLRLEKQRDLRLAAMRVLERELSDYPRVYEMITFYEEYMELCGRGYTYSYWGVEELLKHVAYALVRL
jgi:hypothetical protein